MCCEECPRYEKCVENDRLKDNCCQRCPEYYDCVTIDEREKDSSKDNDHEDYYQQQEEG